MKGASLGEVRHSLQGGNMETHTPTLPSCQAPQTGRPKWKFEGEWFAGGVRIGQISVSDSLWRANLSRKLEQRWSRRWFQELMVV